MGITKEKLFTKKERKRKSKTGREKVRVEENRMRGEKEYGTDGRGSNTLWKRRK